MKTKLVLLTIVTIVTLTSGCMTKGGFAKVIAAAGTADKEVTAKWVGMGGQFEYHSKPVIK